MEELHKELEEMRSAMGKLSEEHRAKSILSEGLRRAHDEQLARLQESKAQIEKQSREIDAKAEEISVTKQMYEDLTYNFHQKESALKELALANRNLRSSFSEKSADLETRNKGLLSALEEANTKREAQERMIRAHNEEMERVKALLSMTQRKCSDAEKRAEAPKELRARDEMLLELEQEKGEVEDRLKWKSEQFRYLEEAHSKTQHDFQGAKKGWELERSELFDEISALQMNLDSQTRAINDLRSQLQMCNRALAHEESRGKMLEIKISESKAMYENVVMEYEDARSSVETLTAKRDEQVAALRISLATKATLLKEAEYSRTRFELENQELKKSLKELQEVQINRGDSNSNSNSSLRQKFRALEQAHRELKAKEAKWASHTEKFGKDNDGCFTKLSLKDEQIQLQVELEGNYSSSTQQKSENEEISVVRSLLEAKFFELCSNLGKAEFQDLIVTVDENNTAIARSQDEIRRDLEIFFLARMEAEIALVVVKEKFLQLTKEAEGTIEELQQQLVVAHILNKHEIQYQRMVMDEMVEEINDLKDCIERLEAKATMERFERHTEKVKAKTLEGQVASLKSEGEGFLELMVKLHDLIGEVGHKNDGLMRIWERVARETTIDDGIVGNDMHFSL